MSFELMRVQRARCKVESTFATEESGSIGSFVDVRFNSAEAATITEHLTNERMVERPYTEPLDINGRKTCGLDLTMDLVGCGTALDNAANTSTILSGWDVGQILKTVFGGVAHDQGSTEDGTASSTDSLVTVASGDGANWHPGTAFGVSIGGDYYMRAVSSVSSDDITPRIQLPSAPADSSTIYNAFTFYLADNPNNSLQFIVESNERNDIWWLLGLNGGVSLELSLNQLVRATFNLQGASYEHDDDVGTPLGSGSSLGEASLGGGDPVVFTNSSLILSTGSAARPIAKIAASEVSFTFNIQYEAIPSPSGVNGIKRWRLMPQRPMVSCQITMPLESEDFWDIQENRTKVAMELQVGNTPGNTWLFEMPNCQLKDWRRADSGGLIGQTFTLKAMEDEDGGTDALGRSPVRWHAG